MRYGAAARRCIRRRCLETGLPASIDVAVLSRGTLLEVRRHRDRVLTRPDGTKTTFSRELLEVHVDLRGQRLVMFAATFDQVER